MYVLSILFFFFFFSSRRRHTRSLCDWSSDVCSSDLRQFAGFGSAAQTNARFKYLLEHGSHGLSVAFDLPTLMGRDPDHPRSEERRVGKECRSLWSPYLQKKRRESQSTECI